MNRILTHIAPSEPAQKESVIEAQSSSVEGLLTTNEAAQLLRLSGRTLERMRVDGTGPRFNKLGPGLRSRVVYRKTDLIAWLESFGYGSTSEYGTD